ncbi:hypothetical protein [Rhizobium terrae]|uniref:hypothetical protein n=1 Tax=Rhizobium terrae TaxID=2171756 RepID=UPI0038577668
MIAKRLVFLVAAALAGCGSASQDKTAPCKRPAELTSFAPNPITDCGKMTKVNGDANAALAAIDALADR